jgi:uncharacterized membrane protein YdcZ (DUF606 family)
MSVAKGGTEKAAKQSNVTLKPLLWLCAVLIGCGNVMKSAVNSSLAITVSAATFGALSSMFGGAIVTMLLDQMDRSKPRDPWSVKIKNLRQSGLKWYQLMGGVLGSVSLGGQTASVEPLGAVLMHILQVVTELIWSAYLDHVGALGSNVKRFSRLRASGCAIAVAGTLLTVVDYVEAPHASGVALVAWCALAIVAGAARSTQTVVNGSLSRSIKSKSDAANWSLLSAMIPLATLFPIEREFLRGVPCSSVGEDLLQSEWWMYLGGIFSCGSVFGAVLLAPHISVTGFYTCVMLGQCAMSVLADHFALGFHQRPVTIFRCVGVLTVLVGSIVVSRSSVSPAKRAVPKEVESQTEPTSPAAEASTDGVQLEVDDDPAEEGQFQAVTAPSPSTSYTPPPAAASGYKPFTFRCMPICST